MIESGSSSGISTNWLWLVGVLVALQSPMLAAEPARVALVIGNANYVIGKLKNPVNDALLVTETLKAQGFQVTTLTNATKRQMKTGIRNFTGSLDEQSVGLFYFAGHGIEVNGSNYLIPVDADIVSEEDVEYESINAGRLLNGLEMVNNGLNLVILDACRNNPYARSFRSSTRGLNRMQPASGSLIMYATEPGNVASDGSGSNGVFTTHLVDAINQQGKKIEEVFKITAINVSKATGKKQTPYIEGVILGDFYFSDDTRAESNPAKSPVISSDGSGEHERLFWNSVIADPSPEMFQAYLEQYPSGNYARLAEIKLEQLVSNDPAVTGHQIAKLENPAVEKDVNQPVSGPTTSGFDVSGSYTSIMKSRRWKETPRVVLTQIGAKIQGVLIPDKGYGLEGKIKDNIIEFTYFAQFAPITGTWKISDDGTTLSGDWEPNTGSNYGTWELIKIGDKAVAE